LTSSQHDDTHFQPAGQFEFALQAIAPEQKKLPVHSQQPLRPVKQ
jgi:hypothetical protein